MARRTDDDFRDEIEAHVALEADRLEAEGMSRADAEAAARRAFGNMTRRVEVFHDQRPWAVFERVARDVRHAWRRVTESPVVATTIVLSLALGIGVNTAIFSLADQALLRSLPVVAPEELVHLEWNGPFEERGMGSVGYGRLLPHLLFRELREENEVFDDVFARAVFDVHVSAGGESEPASAELVSGSYFPTLGVRPVLGRLLDDGDDLRPGAHSVVVVSHDLWRDRLDADPEIVGERILVNNTPMTVVGVAEPGFHGMDWSMAAELWVPVMMKPVVTPSWDGLDQRRTRFLQVYGRLRDGVSAERARAGLGPWFQGYLRAETEREGWPAVTEQQLRAFLASTLEVHPGGGGQAWMRPFVEKPMKILTAAAGVILLLACLNVANLSLARALARRRTTALRTALGASRWRIVGEHLLDSGLLALVGTVAGVAVAPAVMGLLLSFLPTRGAAELGLTGQMDLRALGFAAAAGVLTALLAGAAPAVFAASVAPVTVIKEQAARAAGGMGVRRAFVVAQFSLALLLLVGAGLFAQTLAKMRAAGPGYSTENMLTFALDPIGVGYAVAEVVPTVERALESVASLPEVESVGAARFEMLRVGGWNNRITLESGGRRWSTEEYISMNGVTPGLFEVLGATILRGRGFDLRDERDEEGIRTAIVNQELVRRYFAEGENPVGARMAFGDSPAAVPGIEIVGVVSNFHAHGVREAESQFFFPFAPSGPDGASVYLRARTDSDAVARSIREAVGRVDPALPVQGLRTLDAQLDRLLMTERMLSTLAVAFAALATVLAVIGLYGVLSYSATRRTKEIGIRLALGSSRGEAAGLILREASVLALLGLLVAAPLVWFLGRLIESQLYGVRPMDALTLAGAAALLVGAALAAGAIPARRAGAVNPLDALRAE